MEKYRAIPPGYMTVGEAAKKMKTTVRTLQYYDREGLLAPSGETEGGRRLYTDKDLVMLHQIQSLKYLGFSLDDIKNRLITLDTPEQVASALSVQEEAIREKIAQLDETLTVIHKLKEETLQMQTVNFRKYADIVEILQNGDGNYWVVKGITDTMWEHIRSKYDMESAKVYMAKQKKLYNKAAEMLKAGIPPDSEEGCAISEEWRDLIIEFTGGDMSLMPDMMKFAENRDLWDNEWREDWEKTEGYLSAAFDAYVNKLGYNPFETEAR